MSSTASIALQLELLLKLSLNMLKHGPKALPSCFAFISEQNDIVMQHPLAELEQHIRKAKPNDPVLNLLAFKVHEWDHGETGGWAGETEPHTESRRNKIAALLGISPSFCEALNTSIPIFSPAERSTVVAESHKKWYSTRQPQLGEFYWNAYVGQLTKAQWTQPAIDLLHETTSDVIARLSDPTRREIHQVKGLVVGYVQSGKTAHFSGVIAKSADAGYRLIIVLAGTLNILRRQTQRRLDKEIIGAELLAGGEYSVANDWAEFVRHGAIPSELGSFDWERLTGLEDDYLPLGTRLGALRFRKQDITKPFNDFNNLRFSPVRLIVIKKIPQIIKRLARDLEELGKQGNNLNQIPTLIIDDESDQASVNTINTLKTENAKKRTATNNSIITLLSALPRAQYIGYTATPFANVFVDPLDAEQLFPKDFIVSLARPANYMGVANFFDFDGDIDARGRGPNERTYVRNIEGDDSDEQNLPRAIDSFVLSGAIKLYRTAKDSAQYRYKHHTMLVHHSSARIIHASQAEQVQAFFEIGRFTSAKSKLRLSKLFESDFSMFRSPLLPFPKSFDELAPFIGDCIARIKSGKPVLIVNGDDNNVDDTPDFETGPVWAILVGGAKLSRGYTVEGLTTTYYRRITNSGDTLMQMGRWFGFRPGYADLVRWFVGRKEPKGKGNKKTVDLYEQFGAICRDEEAFRAELTLYAQDENIKPSQVPPLVHSHLPNLKPTAKNKMYNAVLKFKNFSGRWTEKTLISDTHAAHNADIAAKLLQEISLKKSHFDMRSTTAGKITFDAYYGIASTAALIKFLRAFRWSSTGNPIHYELQYLDGKYGDSCVDDCLIMLPQLKSGEEPWSALPPMTVVERARVGDGDGRFKVFSEPNHVHAAGHISATEIGLHPNAALEALRNPRRAVLLMYRVRPRGNFDAPISIGFGLQFPHSKISQLVAWGARDPAKDDIVIGT